MKKILHTQRNRNSNLINNFLKGKLCHTILKVPFHGYKMKMLRDKKHWSFIQLEALSFSLFRVHRMTVCLDLHGMLASNK